MKKLNSLKPGYKKLALHKETLRELTAKDLVRIASGSAANRHLSRHHHLLRRNHESDLLGRHVDVCLSFYASLNFVLRLT